MGYSRDEQECVLTFDGMTGKWLAYSTSPKFIRKIMSVTNDYEVIEEEDGRVIAIKAELKEKQIGIKNVRVMSEEQKQQAAERLSKARESLNN